MRLGCVTGPAGRSWPVHGPGSERGLQLDVLRERGQSLMLCGGAERHPTPNELFGGHRRRVVIAEFAWKPELADPGDPLREVVGTVWHRLQCPKCFLK